MSGMRLVGEQVTVSGTADLAVGHGRFRLENDGAAPVRASVEQAWLEVDGRRLDLVPATVFDEARGLALDPNGFDVPPGSLTFLLGFPRVRDPTGPYERAAVAARVRAGGETLEARSPVVFERRIPRR